MQRPLEKVVAIARRYNDGRIVFHHTDHFRSCRDDVQLFAPIYPASWQRLAVSKLWISSKVTAIGMILATMGWSPADALAMPKVEPTPRPR